jgi:hypothetical protein
MASPHVLREVYNFRELHVTEGAARKLKQITRKGKPTHRLRVERGRQSELALHLRKVAVLDVVALGGGFYELEELP